MQITLSDANFDEETKKATMPVVVDFWAAWCVEPNTSVALIDGSQVLAKDVLLQDRLLGISRDKLASGQVSFSRVDSDLGHCREVVVETGRKVKVTDDHPLFTPRGWVAASDIRVGETVAVLPIGDFADDGLVSKRELVLARLVGFLFSDGSLYYQKSNNYWEVSFSVGQTRDVEAILDDVEELGFFRAHVQELTKHQEIAGRKFTTHLFRIKYLSREFFELLAGKGVPVGAKKSQSYGVPDWIKVGPLVLKREFLRGFLGGDGPKVSMTEQKRKAKRPFNHLGINDLEFHKDPNLERSGLNLANEVAHLLGELGVSVSKVFSEKDSYTRKDGKNSAVIHLQFKKEFQNAYNLVYKVGYAYCVQKQRASSCVAEFIRQILFLRETQQELYCRVKELASQGHGYRYVSRALKVNPTRAYLWIKDKARATIAKHGLKFDSWVSERLSGAPEGFLWEKVIAIQPIFLPAVAKITVEDTHSFVANGFLSHNCGPCRLMEPIIEDLTKELDGKVIIGKLDVDANQQTAVKFGVMSIPTTIMFKGGVEVRRLVGYQDKATLVRNINDILVG